MISVSLNLPRVLKQFEKAAEEKRVSRLQEQFFRINQEVERRRENLHVLSLIPAVKNLLEENKTGDIPYPLVQARLKGLVTAWFNPLKDVFSIHLVHRSGMERLSIRRDGNGELTTAGLEGRGRFLAPDLLARGLEGEDAVFVADLSVGPSEEYGEIRRVTLGAPVRNNQGALLGLALMEIDLNVLLASLSYQFLVKGDGTYLFTSKKGGGHRSAFSEFEGLEDLVREGRPAIVSDHSGEKVAWFPVIMDDSHSATRSLWMGNYVGEIPLEQWTRVFVAKLGMLVLFVMCVQFVLAMRLAKSVDRVKQTLLQGLKRLLNKGEAVDFHWTWPWELRELGRELSSLSRRFVEADRARRKAENALANLSRQQAMILNSAAEGILGLDSECNVVFVNPAAVKMLGFRKEEILGEDLHCLVHFLRPDRSQYPKEDCPFCQSLATGTFISQGDDIFWRQDGSRINVQYVTAPIRDEQGRIQGMVMCIRDVTRQKEAEEKMVKLQAQLLQAQKMEAIGTLAGGVAHDFNNLLTAITGYSELLLHKLDPVSPLHSHAKAIQEAATRAGDLTRQLLTFSRKQQILVKVVDLNSIVANLEKMLSRIIGEDIELVTDLTREKCDVKADPGMLEQVLMNLVVNARDAMPDGGRIIIRTRTGFEPNCRRFPENIKGKFVCMCVEDNGVGMDEETQKRIFDPFFTTKGLGKGTGLGLSVVYGIVEQHGGWVEVQSEPGKGSVFRIFLSVSEEEKESGSENDFADQEVPQANGERILLLEDEDQVRQVVKDMLEGHGYEVVAAANLRDALDLFEREAGRFDLFMSDVVLPDGSGLEFTDFVLSRRPDAPVLIYSGYAEDKSQMAIIRKRNLPFLQKPFTRLELLRAVYKLIPQKSKA